MKEIHILTDSRHCSAPKIRKHLGQLGAKCLILHPEEITLQIHRGQIRVYDAQERRLQPEKILNWVLDPRGPGQEVLMALKEMGVQVINSPLAWRRAKLKPLTSLALTQWGVPHPKTLFSQGTPPDLPDLPRPWVFKPWDQRGALGVRRISSPDPLPSPTYLQEFIHSSGPTIRVIVLFGQATLAADRLIDSKHWPRFSRYQPRPLTPELSEMAVLATQAVGLDIAGVDLIEGPMGTMVLEVNAKPGLYYLNRDLGVDLAQMIARALLGAK